MINKSTIKEQLFRACTEEVEARIRSIREVLQSIEEARNNETKSSVGDKYETGRSMMQIEEANNRSQLARALQLKQELSKAKPQPARESAGVGSLVETDKALYYLSIGIGKVVLEDRTYYCVSVNSPIGRQLMHKTIGDTLVFNGNQIRIEALY